MSNTPVVGKCNYLLDQALLKLWSSPRADNQHILEPTRISKYNGAWNYVDAGMNRYTLPKANTAFHVYQIGQIYPALLNLFPRQDQWVKISDNCNELNVLVNLYNQKGIELPRFDCYYLVTLDRNVLIACKLQPRIAIDLNKEPLYIRVYANTFFQGSNFNNSKHYIKISGTTVKNQETILDIKRDYDAIRKASSQTPYLFINGIKSNILNLETVKVGDVVEVVEDTSIYRYVEFRVNKLPTFDSKRDLKRKYLLHYQSRLDVSLGIDYNDDIDVYIVRKDPKGVNPLYSGYYYHRNNEDAMRNVTHKDYSLAVPYVTEYTKQLDSYYEEDQTNDGWVIQLYIRKSGWVRPLVFTHDRLLELYKLEDRYVYQALLGRDSVVDEWRADNLENSPLMRLVSWRDYNIPREMVEDAWGYNAVSKMVGDTPSKVELYNNQRIVKLPLMLRRYVTAFEYDNDGLLIGWYNHVGGSHYKVRDSRTASVELIGGVVGNVVDEYYNVRSVTSDEWVEFQYRFYRRLKDPLGEWEDVTHSNLYIKTDKGYEWLLDMNKYDTLVRSDKSIVVTRHSIRIRRGVLKATLTYPANRGDGVQTYLQEVPFSELDVFLNGYSLVYGIDYNVVDNVVYVTNKRYLDNPSNKDQILVIRQYGLTGNKARAPLEDIGWVQHGLLSRNNKYDIRDDRVLRIVVGGRLKHREDLSFSELDTGVSVGVANGLPYEIKDLLVPLRNIVEQDHLEYRLRSNNLDNKISLYMTRFIKEPKKTNLSPITSYWAVYSPFCSALIADIKSGKLNTNVFIERKDDDYLREFVKDYNYLLATDPTQDDVYYDSDFMRIHPTFALEEQTLSIIQYHFIERVVKLLLNDKVDLSSFIKIV